MVYCPLYRILFVRNCNFGNPAIRDRDEEFPILFGMIPIKLTPSVTLSEPWLSVSTPNIVFRATHMDPRWRLDSVIRIGLNRIDRTICKVDDKRIPVFPNNMATSVHPTDATIR